MNAEPTPSCANCVQSIMADTTAAANPTSDCGAARAAISQKMKPRPIAATRPETIPNALPVNDLAWKMFDLSLLARDIRGPPRVRSRRRGQVIVKTSSFEVGQTSQPSQRNCLLQRKGNTESTAA
jgi:hypothetical protein